MNTTEKTTRVLLSFGLAFIVCFIGLLGYKTPLVYLLEPGFYLIGSRTHAVGILSLLVALPLSVLFYTAVIFTILCLCIWLLRKRMETA
jgi:hypothetical protein